MRAFSNNWTRIVINHPGASKLMIDAFLTVKLFFALARLRQCSLSGRAGWNVQERRIAQYAGA